MASYTAPSPFVRPARVGTGGTTGNVPLPGELLSADNRVVAVGQLVTVADETYGMLDGRIVQILPSGAVVIDAANNLRLVSYPAGRDEPDVPLRLPWLVVRD